MARTALAAFAALALVACEDEPETTAQSTPADPAAAQASPADAPQTAAVPAADADIRVDDLVVGDAAAPVTVFAFESLTCPHCASFHRDVWPSIKDQFVDAGDVKFVFRDFPLNRPALFGSALARCFDDDRRYGLMQMMFARQSEWAGSPDPAAALVGYAAQAGLGESDARTCINDTNAHNRIVQTMQADAAAYNVQATPSFVIDGAVAFRGAPSVESFAAALNDKLGR